MRGLRGGERMRYCDVKRQERRGGGKIVRFDVITSTNLHDGFGCLFAKILDCILIAEPIGSFHGVIEVVLPTILLDAT